MAWITADNVADFFGDVIKSAPDMARYGQVANTACNQIERHCDRIFEAADYRVWLDGSGESTLVLPQYPIITLYLVADDIDDAFTIGNTSADATDFYAACANGKLQLQVYGGVNAGSETLTLSAYTSMALLVAAIVALGKGWTATVRNEGDPQSLYWQAHECDITETTYFSVANSRLAGIRPDYDRGILHKASKWTEGCQNYFVHYRAGYTTVPADLTEVAKQLAADLLEASEHGRTLSSERTGDYSRSTREDAPIMHYAQDLAQYRNLRA